MKAILACTPSGGIGYNNSLPWTRLEGDLPRFKALTSGKTVVMGRKTYESIGFGLPNRTNLVFSRGKVLPIKNYGPDAWVIGGAEIFELFYQYVDEIHLSITHREYECDTFIHLDKIVSDFRLTSFEELEDHTYQIWTR